MGPSLLAVRRASFSEAPNLPAITSVDAERPAVTKVENLDDASPAAPSRKVGETLDRRLQRMDLKRQTSISIERSGEGAAATAAADAPGRPAPSRPPLDPTKRRNTLLRQRSSFKKYYTSPMNATQTVNAEGALSEKPGDPALEEPGSAGMTALKRVKKRLLAIGLFNRAMRGRRQENIKKQKQVREEQNDKIGVLRRALRFRGRDRDIEKVERLLLLLAPALFKGVPPADLREVAAKVDIGSYKRQEVVFLQNDHPNGYYYVIAGRVSVHRHETDPTTGELIIKKPEGDEDENALSSLMNAAGPNGRRMTLGNWRVKANYGRKVAEIGHGNGFGELAFVRGGGNAARAATIISEGDRNKALLGYVTCRCYCCYY